VLVAEAIGRALAQCGPRHVFGLIGSGNFVVTNALVAGGMSYVAARHEGGAISMADAYAQLSGQVGMCSVHQGPGLTNTMTGLTEAAKSRTPLLVLAGTEYGAGSSRDWAAKGTLLLGVRVVLAESYERIHRSNLVGMGVLPLQFKAGESAETFGITGKEALTIVGVSGAWVPRQDVTIDMVRADGSRTAFVVIARLDTPVEINYYRNGGILQTVLRKMLKG